MNEMYDMSVVIHLVAVIVLVGLIVLNISILKAEKDIHQYAYKMRKLLPISYSMIVIIIFTGAVMMAAKHLEFSTANIAMIILSLYLIPVEIKRYKSLKHLNIKAENAFENYKKSAQKILISELGLIVLISIWMFIL
jgi:hypothetical protein